MRTDFEFALGVSTWISTGNTKWSHDASSVNPNLGNPTSELEYEDLWSNVVQFDGLVTHRTGVFGRAQFGYGAINDGTLADDDFAVGQVLASRTESDIDGDNLWYVNADVGFRFLEFRERRGSLSVFVGYQHWEEKAVAKTITQVASNPTACTAIGTTCAPAGTVSNVGQTVITNEARWDSVRVGLEGLYQLTRALGVDGAVAVIPYTSLNNDDVHLLRTDLRKDPSFSMSGTGYGVNAEAGFTYRILAPLFVQVGYRFWWLRVTDGDWTTHPVGSPPLTVNLNEFRSLRHGATVGLTYRF